MKRSLEKSSILSVCLVFCCAAAGAATYYVSVAGNDTTGNGGPGNPWATIQRAVNAAGPGDTVLVNNGTYAGFHSVNGGTAANPVTVRANGTNVIINSRNASTTDNVNIENTNYVTVEGFRSVNAPRCGIRVAGSRGVTVRNNVCSDAAMWGIFTAFAPEVVIDSNTCFGTVGQHGIYVSNSNVPNDAPVVSNNTCYGNYQNGIQFNGDINSGGDGNIEGAVISGNKVYANGWKGLSLISITGGTVRNNLVYGNGTRGAGAGGIHLALEPTSLTPVPSNGNIIVNNTVVEPSIACIRITAGSSNVVFNNLCAGPTLIDDEPGGNSVDAASNVGRTSIAGLFKNAAGSDYALADGSPAIGAGVAVYAGRNAPATDILGNARPAGGGYDAGAYEHIPAGGQPPPEQPPSGQPPGGPPTGEPPEGDQPPPGQLPPGQTGGLSRGEVRVVGSAALRGAINPDRGDTAKIYFKGTDAGRFEIRIFSFAGDLVWSHELRNVSEGMFEWAPRGIASGSYVVRVSGPGVSARKKIAVVR